MLPNSPHVKEVVLGENRVLAGAKPGLIIIVDRAPSRRLLLRRCGQAAEQKVEMLDAPVSGENQSH